MRAVATVVLLCLALPAWGQTGACRGQAYSVQRDLQLNNRLSANDRFQAEERLNRAQGLCTNDPPRASDDLERLRKDIIQQSTLPPQPSTPPGTPGVPGRP
ncbi:MAG TPA: hypothetical protein VL974_07660 [Magnetospirillum sp.]|jgi:hypothetical protein|nr:hypothetical protein [Magnetospirillum sp.]